MAAEFGEDGGAANWVTLRRALHRRRRAYELHRIGLWLVALVAFASFGAKSFVRLVFEIPAFQRAPRSSYGAHRGSLLVRLLPYACLWVCDAQRNMYTWSDETVDLYHQHPPTTYLGSHHSSPTSRYPGSKYRNSHGLIVTEPGMLWREDCLPSGWQPRIAQGCTLCKLQATYRSAVNGAAAAI